VTNQISIKELKLLNPVCAVAAELGLALSGRRAPAPAGLHCDCRDAPAILRFDPERHAIACDACGKLLGSVLDLVCAVQGCDMKGAMAWLEHRVKTRGLDAAARQGIILVDHGSRREEANEMLLDVAAVLQTRAPDAIIHIAHMELAPPTIADAFDACVKDGAADVVVHPYFLAPGKHAMTDIPDQAEAAGQRHPTVPWRVTAPLGLHPAMADVILARVAGA